MLPENPWDSWIVRALAYVSLSTIGGIIGYILRSMENRKKILISHLLARAAGSMFAGFIILLLCQAMALDYIWTGVVVGLFGWLGADVSIKLVETFVFKKLGIESKVEPVRERSEDNVS